MKRLLPIPVLLLLSFFTSAQTLVPPHFKGGELKFREFISNHLQMPNDTGGSNVQTRTLIVGFIVEKNGQLSEIKIIKHASPVYDAEALRVMKLSPPWVPATRDGVFIKSKYTVPIQVYVND